MDESCRPNQALGDLPVIIAVHLLLAEMNLAIHIRLVKRLPLEPLHGHHSLSHRIGLGRQKLSGVGPVDLDRVVRRRIVTGRDHNAAVTSFVQHGGG